MKPCPFCGGTLMRQWRYVSGPEYVECQNCDAMITGKTAEEAIQKWESRA